MPIGEQSTIAPHTGNGVATVFAFDFGLLSADDIKVLVDGVEITTGFTVSGVGSRTGGTVTFSVAPANGAAILIVREVVRKRDTDYQYSGDFREEVVDDDFDRLWMALQEDGELVQRGVRAPVGETLSELPVAASRVDKVLTFSTGGAIALVDIAAFTGGGIVELVPADGSITMTKLASAVQNLINGALQRSGGTMTGALTLSGNATNPLEAVPLQQVAAALSFAGLALSATGANANVSISASELLLRGADGSPRLVSGVSLSLNTSGAGANGLDTGSIAASTWYALWVIDNGTTTASLLSLSSTAPTMPSGYTHKARVGWIRTDGTGNKWPLAFSQHGCGVEYEPASGTNLTAYPQVATTNASIGVTSVSLAATVPATSGNVHLRVRQDSVANAANGTNLYTTATGEAQAGALGTNGAQGLARVTLKPRVPGTVYWSVATSTGSAALGVIGWEDNL